MTTATETPPRPPAASPVASPTCRASSAARRERLPDPLPARSGASTAITCGECNAEYSLDEVRDTLASWSKLLAWCDHAPELE